MKVKAEAKAVKANKCIDIRHDLLARRSTGQQISLHETNSEGDHSSINQPSDHHAPNIIK